VKLRPFVVKGQPEDERVYIEMRGYRDATRPRSELRVFGSWYEWRLRYPVSRAMYVVYIIIAEW
jgi:hypothetical protein